MTVFIGLLGGLSLFLYGMQMMSAGLEAAAGDKMKTILKKLTSNRFLGVFVGAGITAVIQSSSATTVMVVGFVNSGMMTLRQAVWIIMGANIGTTITGQLIALDIGAIAPLIAFVGVAGVVFTKNDKVHHIGNILAGLGILFIGMDMMGTAMKPLAQSERFINILTAFDNPILAILAGTIFTAIIQSSSASVGILQTLAGSGVISFSSSVFILFGQNIGTCITALLASIGTSCNARRTTIIHITFNVIGTIVFSVLCIATPIVLLVEGLTPGNPVAQIANMHTIFNVVTTILLIPFGNLLARFAELVLKEKNLQIEEASLFYIQNIKNINEEKLGVTAISMDGTAKEIRRMLSMAKENVHASFMQMIDFKYELKATVDEKEDYIDYLNKEISKYISRVITHERTEKGSQIFNSYLTITGNVERIGDHAVNVYGYSKQLSDKNIQLSEMAKKEVEEIQKTLDKLLNVLLETESMADMDVIEWHARIAAMEQKIDDMTKEYRNNMFERIRNGSCKDEGSILFSEMLTDFERIGDHALNISDEFVKIAMVER